MDSDSSAQTSPIYSSTALTNSFFHGIFSCTVFICLALRPEDFNGANFERGTKAVAIYLDFHSTKRAMSSVDSWSRAPDQVQMYPDRDTIPQLFVPSQLFVCFAVIVEGKVSIYT